MIVALASTGTRRLPWLALSGWLVVALVHCGRRSAVQPDLFSDLVTELGNATDGEFHA